MLVNKLKSLRNGSDEEGFTLIELLVVVLIIGVLSAIAIPIFLNQQNEAIGASVKSDVRNTVTNVATWLASNPNATPDQIGAAGAPGGSIKKVVTANSGNVISVSGTRDNIYTEEVEPNGYSVSGSNPNWVRWTLDNARFYYSFNSSTGLYTTYPEP